MSRHRGPRKSGHTKLGCKSLVMGRESMDTPKFDRERLDMGRESLCPDFCDPFSDFPDQILVCLDFFEPRLDSCPDFPDSNSRRDYAIWV